MALDMTSIPDVRSGTSAGWVMHLLDGYEQRLPAGRADQYAVETLISKSGGWWQCPELFALARALGDEKISAIVHSVLYPRSRHTRVTEKQRWAIANALLTRHGSARAVFAAALGITEAELVAAGEVYDD